MLLVCIIIRPRYQKAKISEKGNFLKNCMGNQCDIYVEIIKRRF